MHIRSIPKLLVLLPFLTGCVSVDLASLLSPELTETVLQPAKTWTPHKILILPIDGFIASGDASEFSWVRKCSPDVVKAMLNKAEKDTRIRAIVLRIDSPGGGVSATDSICHEIKQAAARTQLPVLAIITGVGCSGGYYVANAADTICAHPSSITGSIGVIATFPKLKGLASKVGYEQTVIKSGKMKDLGNPLRDMPEEERRVLQGIIDSMYGDFLDCLVAGRSAYADRDGLAAVADGRIFTARQALDLKLVDRIGYIDDVLQEAMTRARIRDAKVVTYSYRNRGDATVYTPAAARSGLNMLNVNLGGLVPQLRTGFYYLWMPGAGP